MAGPSSPASSPTIPSAWIGIVAGDQLAAHGLLFALWGLVQLGDTGGYLQDANGKPLTVEEIAKAVQHGQRRTARLMGDLMRAGYIRRKRGTSLYLLPHVVNATRAHKRAEARRYGKDATDKALRIAAHYAETCFAINRWSNDTTASRKGRGPKNIGLWLRDGRTEEELVLAADHYAETLTSNNQPLYVGNFYGRETPTFTGFLGDEWAALKGQRKEEPGEVTLSYTQEEAREIFGG